MKTDNSSEMPRELTRKQSRIAKRLFPNENAKSWRYVHERGFKLCFDLMIEREAKLKAQLAKEVNKYIPLMTFIRECIAEGGWPDPEVLQKYVKEIEGDVNESDNPKVIDKSSRYSKYNLPS